MKRFAITILAVMLCGMMLVGCDSKSQKQKELQKDMGLTDEEVEEFKEDFTEFVNN